MFNLVGSLDLFTFDRDETEYVHDAVKRYLNDEPHFWVNDDMLLLIARGKAFWAQDVPETGGTKFTLTVYDDYPDYSHLLQTHPHVVTLSMERALEYDSHYADEDGIAQYNVVDWLGDNIGRTTREEWHGPEDEVVYGDQLAALVVMPHAMSGDVLRPSPLVYFFKDKAKAALFRTFLG